MFFVFFMFWKEHDCSCSWCPTNPSKCETKTKTEANNLRLNRSNPCEKKNQNRSIHQTHMKPKLNQTHQTDLPINAYETKTKSNPLNGSTHQMHIKPKPNQTNQPIYQQNQIKPIKHTNHQMQIKPKPNQTDQPIYHYGSLKVEATTTMAVACGGEEGWACELQPGSYGEERENLRLERV